MAAAMERLSSLKPSFILSLGDNFYVRGVKGLEDPQLTESFLEVYRRGPLAEVPWQVALGDHDHRGNVSALLRWHNERWRLPAPCRGAWSKLCKV